jgi:hypothetical protein
MVASTRHRIGWFFFNSPCVVYWWYNAALINTSIYSHAGPFGKGKKYRDKEGEKKFIFQGSPQCHTPSVKLQQRWVAQLISVSSCALKKTNSSPSCTVKFGSCNWVLAKYDVYISGLVIKVLATSPHALLPFFGEQEAMSHVEDLGSHEERSLSPWMTPTFYCMNPPRSKLFVQLHTHTHTLSYD